MIISFNGTIRMILFIKKGKESKFYANIYIRLMRFISLEFSIFHKFSFRSEERTMAKKKTAPAKKKASGVKKYIAKAPIRRLMKDEGAKLVAEAAVDLLISKLEKTATDVTKNAIKLVKTDKRKRLTAPDIQMATR
ncbi:MAG: hypothetical protein EU530_01955 [Promethearchaeota archaeon]|nr:MAG: hypothetical protein EU530_01955 [Candidatus Lokiarchaeota archaeon]